MTLRNVWLVVLAAWLAVVCGCLAIEALANRNPFTTFVIAYTNEKGEFEVIKHSAHSYTMSFGCATFDKISTVCRIILITPEVE